MSRRPETRSVSQSSQAAAATPDASGVDFAAQAAAAVQQFELPRCAAGCLWVACAARRA